MISSGVPIATFPWATYRTWSICGSSGLPAWAISEIVRSRARLRSLTDEWLAAAWILAEDQELPLRGRKQPQDRRDQRSFAAPVGSEDRRNRSGRNCKVGVPPHRLPAVAGRQVPRHDRRLRHDHAANQAARAEAFKAFSRARSWDSCQSWNVADSGWRVSETPTTGISARAARCLMLVVTAVAVCPL